MKTQEEFPENKKPLKPRINRYFQRLLCARGRNRTDTTFTGDRILSPARLPVPPPGLELVQNKYFLNILQFIYNLFYTNI